MNALKTIVLPFLVIILILGISTYAAFQGGFLDESRLRKREAVASDDPQAKLYDPDEEHAIFWNKRAQSTLAEHLAKSQLTGVAKNVIFFLGDGMSIPTLAAARTYMGQTLLHKPGEETVLSLEKFPYVGLSKTYCVNKQVPDSACSATAYLTGVKGNLGTIGVTGYVQQGDCKAAQNKTNQLESIARRFQLAGKSTGFVTTTRVTHASPAGLYANTAHRDWESDTDVTNAKLNPKLCPDIATQLIHGETGRNFNVIMGGGRGRFLPNDVVDEDGNHGLRSDGRDLIREWSQLRQDTPHRYVWDRTSLLQVPNNTDYILGLFEHDHIPYNMDRNVEVKPSLAEMTKSALDLLSRNQDGYFLFVEGGRIDHAHHETRAHKALDETVEFHKAVETAVQLTDPLRTLIVVTSDHAHTMSMSGYAPRGNDILGSAGMGTDSIPYATLNYANGGGYYKEENSKRHDISQDDMHNKDYRFPSLVPLKDETHGGDDVAIFARGPWSHLFTGVMEQNVLPHIVSFAACVGKGLTVCDEHQYY